MELAPSLEAFLEGLVRDAGWIAAARGERTSDDGAEMISVPVLSIGCVAGGTRASKSWESSIKRLGRRVVELRGHVESPLHVNVVFQIPGELTTPEFEGVRTGRFSRKKAWLLVQVAVPPEPRRDADAEVRALLENAIGLAEDFARRKGLTKEPRLDGLRTLLGRL